MTVTLATAMFAGAIVAAVFFIVGLFVGLLAADGYKSKRTCRECMRGFVQNGFIVDGEDYEVARRIVRGAKMLGKTGLGRTGW